MSYPKELLMNVYWAFSEGPIAKTDFNAVFTEYHESISNQKLPFKFQDIIFEYPYIAIQYSKYTEDDVEEPDVLVKADNGIHFTVGELLYKIHQIGLDLEEDDNCYFEGLKYSGSTYEYEESNGTIHAPAYFMITGS